MHLELMKQGLLSRWKQAFNEIEILEANKTNIRSEKYVPGFRYELEDYGTPSFLQPEGKLFPEAAVREISDYHFYGFGENGLPCYTSYGHVTNKVGWEGHYIYGQEWVEYIEYNAATYIPVCIKRILYEDGQKVAFQSLTLNGKGSVEQYGGLTADHVIERILRNEHALFCTLHQYKVSAGRIVKADCLEVAPGTGECRHEDIYRYDSEGVLEEVRTLFENGESRLSYVKPDKDVDVQVLLTAVAEKMAVAITDTLEACPIETPLALLELSYHYADAYIPLLSPRSVAFTKEISRNHPDEDIFDLIFLATELDHAYLEIAPAKFERPFTQLMQIISKEAKWEVGTLLLRKVAHLLTTSKVLGRIPVGAGFTAYAIDWGIEMEDFEDILRECGATGKAITSWKEQGWL
jgi:hypothetical protein